MPLPVLPPHAMTSDADLLRLYLRTERLWTEHLAEAEQLDVGVAMTAPDLPNVWDANRVLEAALPPGVSPEQAVAEVEAHFAARAVRCRGWQINPSAQPTSTAPLAAHLTSVGCTTETQEVMALSAPPRPAEAGVPGVTILPARAAFRHARELADEAARMWQEPQIAEGQMRHLDDPHCDALLAVRGGRAVGRIVVMAVGEVGRIDAVYVARDARRQGVGRLLLARAMEVCARSQFRQVMLGVDADNEPAKSLYRSIGFRKIGELTTFRPQAA